MVKYKVGDIIVSADGSSYVGEIIYVSKEEDVVRHRCRKTGTEYEKSYFGFQCRYMTVEERLEKDKEFCTENIQLHQQIFTMEREHNDATRRLYAFQGRWSVFAMKVVEERNELRHRLAGEAAHIKSLEGLLVDAVRERDEARHTLGRIAAVLFSSRAPLDDEELVGAVLMVVRERDALKERIARMMESMSMACEEPPAGCECAGCMYSRARGGDA